MESTLVNISLKKGCSMLSRFVKSYWNDRNFLNASRPDIYCFTYEYISATPEQVKNVLALFYFKFWTDAYIEKHPTEDEIIDFIQDYNQRIATTV